MNCSIVKINSDYIIFIPSKMPIRLFETDFYNTFKM